MWRACLVMLWLATHDAATALRPLPGIKTAGINRIVCRGAARCVRSTPTRTSALARPVVAAGGSSPEEARFSYRDALLTKKSLLVGGFAFVAGWLDVFCFHAYGCYSTMLTGNTIAMGSALVGSRLGDAAFYAALIALHMGGVVFFRLVDGRARPLGATKRARGLSSTRVAALAVLALFMAADALAAAATTTRAAASRWPVLLLGFGGGIVNCVSSDKTGTVTCMVTVHMQRLAVHLVDALSPRSGGAVSSAQHTAAIVSAGAVAAFFAGVACGAAALGAAATGASNSPAALLTKFTVAGVAYAALMFLHDANFPWRLHPTHSAR